MRIQKKFRIFVFVAVSLLACPSLTVAAPIGYSVRNHGSLFRPSDMNNFGEILSNGTIENTGIAVSNGESLSTAPPRARIPGIQFGDSGPAISRIAVNIFPELRNSRISDFGTLTLRGGVAGGEARFQVTPTLVSLRLTDALSVSGLPGPHYIDGYDLRLSNGQDANNGGDLVIEAVTRPNAAGLRSRDILRVEAGERPEVIVTGAESEITVTNENPFISNSAFPKINARGDIAFRAVSPLFDDPGGRNNGILFYSDEGGLVPAIATPIGGNRSGLLFDINDAGQIVTTTGFGRTLVIRDPDGSTRSITMPGVITGLDINNAGTVAAFSGGVSSSSGFLYTVSPSGEVSTLLESGDTLLGLEVGNVGLSASNTPFIAINDAGQVAAALSLVDPEAAGGRRSDVFVFSPPGATPENPSLPIPGGTPGVWNFSGDAIPAWARIRIRGESSNGPSGQTATRGRTAYFDPEVALGYNYVSNDGSNLFSGVEVPYEYGDGLFDLFLFDNFLADYVDSGFDLLAGEFFNLLDIHETGVSKFSLRGIEASAGVDPADPLGFVTGLTFLEGSSDGFTMTALTSLDDGSEAPDVEVSLPGTLPLFGLCSLVMLFRFRRQRHSFIESVDHLAS